MIWRTIKIAIRAIISNKMRSFLTMLGIIIGVVAVVMLVSIGQGTRNRVAQSIASMGSNLLTANITDDSVMLYKEDIETLENYDAIGEIAPIVSTSSYVQSGSTTYSTTVIGITPEYADVMNADVQSGRMIADSDVEWRTPVCVLGTDVATEVFDSWDVIGKTVTIGDREFTVVGLLEESGSSSGGSNDDRVLISLATAQRMTGQTNITRFYVTSTSDENVTQSENLLNMFLLNITRDEEAFTVYNQSEVLETMSEVTDTFSLMLGGIAAISLLVGGIGIMNIMLVSVAERTQEIGIRKAIGAKRRNIMGQFLVEACVLSVLGGLIGVALSILGIQVYNIIADMNVTMSVSIAVASVGFCAVMGIAFGSYPAAKASKLVPIEALRYS